MLKWSEILHFGPRRNFPFKGVHLQRWSVLWLRSDRILLYHSKTSRFQAYFGPINQNFDRNATECIASNWLETFIQLNNVVPFLCFLTVWFGKMERTLGLVLCDQHFCQARWKFCYNKTAALFTAPGRHLREVWVGMCRRGLTLFMAQAIHFISHPDSIVVFLFSMAR